MPPILTEDRGSSVDRQTMLNAGLNAFAVDLLVESYAKMGREDPKPCGFTFRGVSVILAPYTPQNAEIMYGAVGAMREATNLHEFYAAMARTCLRPNCGCPFGEHTPDGTGCCGKFSHCECTGFVGNTDIIGG